MDKSQYLSMCPVDLTVLPFGVSHDSYYHSVSSDKS